MKNLKKMLWVGAALLAAACGTEKLWEVIGSDKEVVVAPEPTQATEAPAPGGNLEMWVDHPEPGTVPSSESLAVPVATAIRIRGVNLGEHTAMLVDVSDLRVWVDGVEQPVALDRTAIDLAKIEHAFLVGSFILPDGAKEVVATMRLDMYGGYEGAAAGWVDSRASLLKLKMTAENLAIHHHAVVSIDVGRSLFGAGEERLLLPTYQVRY